MSTKYVKTRMHGDSKTVYHTDPDCPRVKGGLRAVTTGEVDYHELTECHYCQSKGSTNGNQNPEDTYKDCPFCGENVYHLANHLPECPER